jgi:fucose permease
MSIVGGAILPLALGYIADATNNIQNGYIVPLICFVVVLYFGLKGYKRKLSYEEILPDLRAKERSAVNTAV